MRISDRAPLEYIGQAVPELEKKPATAPPKPQPSSVPKGPLVVSAIVTRLQKPAENVVVYVYEKDGAELAIGKTDKNGRVFFDIEADTPNVVLMAAPPKGFQAYPSEAAREAHWTSESAPGPNWFRQIWDWTDSVKFRLVEGVASETEKKEAEEENKDKGFFTLKNMLIVGGIAVAGYFVLRSLSGNE